jgi:TetR/AcrR family transcriptional repressor of uid operon
VPRRAPTLNLETLLAGLEEPPAGDDLATAAMLDATSSLLATYGMRRWTMDDVAEQSGLGRATVYRRFDSRDELLHATLARDARRFFAAIAAAVAPAETVLDKVVDGLIVGLRMARGEQGLGLYRSEPAAIWSLLSTGPVLGLARRALVERYQVVTGAELGDDQLAEAELVAEMLVRIGASFLLMPASVVDLDDTDAARRSLRRIIGPLLTPPQ